MRIIFIVLLTIVNSSPCFAFVKEKKLSNMLKRPHFYNIGSTSSNSVLTMECVGEDPYDEIECYFTEVVVRNKNDDQKKKLWEENSLIIDNNN